MGKKQACILFFVAAAYILLLSRCTNNRVEAKDPRGIGYVGSLSCRQCHRSLYDSYLQSAHYSATQPASKKNIQGSFKPGENTFSFSADTKIVLQDRDSGLYQVAYVNGKEKEAHRFDITFGVKNAQTFLTWQDDKTYELPVSYYYSVNSWATSPGFSPKEVNFKRFIGADCFECHSSYIKSNLNASTSGIEEALDRNSLVYGIDCERCHGPAINHVNYHIAYPDVKQAKYMVTPASLLRQQKLDMCAVCHSGNDKMKKFSRFEFRPGDTLSNFFFPSAGKHSSGFDVHGNQYQLLSESKCFLGSNTLNCTTCHNPHTNSGNDLKVYSDKCISCHTDVVHDFVKEGSETNALKTNCIDCHMPKQASTAITFQLPGSAQTSAYLLRTHKIAVYTDDAKKIANVVGFYKKNKG